MTHFLITGHTGFKGTWLIHLLRHRGHEVSGLALDPIRDSLFDRSNAVMELSHDKRVDIRNREALRSAIREIEPEVVIHLAAQSLVREGYREPFSTFEVNVLGTANVISACDAVGTVDKLLVVTSDKVYRETGGKRHYSEEDELGGEDPYSSSKALADRLAQDSLSSPSATPGAIARAGNVIGAGDQSVDRLIPDIVRSVVDGTPLELRYPAAIRPWQHVLDCLEGYLKLVNSIQGCYRGVWNFGPDETAVYSVQQVVEYCTTNFFPDLDVRKGSNQGMVESDYLMISSEKAKKHLAWSSKIDAKKALAWSIRSPADRLGSDLRSLVTAQIAEFEMMARGLPEQELKTNDG